jgi:hypothetical protein
MDAEKTITCRRGTVAVRVLAVLLVVFAMSGIALPSSASTPPTRCHGVPEPAEDPCLTATPSSGPVGTRILLSGNLTINDPWLRRVLNTDFIGLIRDVEPSPRHPLGCEIIAGGGHPVLRVTRSGRVLDAVPLIVSGRGSCDHFDRHHDVTPGTYEIFAGCFTCDVAVFRVTRDSPPLASTGAPIATGAAVGILLIALGACLLLCSRRTPPRRHQ